MNTGKIYEATVETNKKISSNIYRLEFCADEDINAIPGQFVSILCEGLTFRRPFCIYSNNNGNIGILYKIRGKGTTYIASKQKGDKINFSGVFGNGFMISGGKSLLTGAGTGIAPMAFLKQKLDETGIANEFIAGFLTKDEIPPFIPYDEIYTDDGSCGHKGSVISNIDKVIEEFKPETIYACGPIPVLKKVAEAGEKHQIKTYVSLEKVMACSIGVCRGCVIDIKRNGKVQNASVCKDGPVFEGSEVVWETL